MWRLAISVLTAGIAAAQYTPPPGGGGATCGTPNCTVAGNLSVSGTASIGAGITGPGLPITAHVHLSAAQLISLTNTNSVQLLPAVAGKIYSIMSVVGQYTFGSTPFTITNGGDGAALQVAPSGIDVDGQDWQVMEADIGNYSPLGSADMSVWFHSVSTVRSNLKGAALALYLYSGDGMGSIAGGDGSLDLYITYIQVP